MTGDLLTDGWIPPPPGSFRVNIGHIQDDKMPLLLAEDGYQKFEITYLEECVRCSMSYSDTISIVLKLKNAYSAISGYLAQKMLLRDLGVMIEIYPQGENRIEIFGDLAKNESLE